MLRMARKKPAPPETPPVTTAVGSDRHTTPRVVFHLDDKLLALLDTYRDSQRLRPGRSEVMRLALREFLEREGFTTPKPPAK